MPAMPILSQTPRLRHTPFSYRVESAGIKAYTVYNHMLPPTVFRSLEEDYAHLKSAVQIWDVSCQRQVEVVGQDAQLLVQMTTPRDLLTMAGDRCYYAPMVDDQGCILNDPVVFKRGADRYWVSLADTDLLLYYKGLAAGFNLRVHVVEPDVSPLAIQGPRASELIGRVFGTDVAKISFFHHRLIKFQGQEMVISRTGWSHQDGFEIFVEGTQHGGSLWDCLFEAGEDLDVRAGGPNGIERIEAGLLSYGNDMTAEHTPFEANLGRYCDLRRAKACLGHAPLLAKQSPNRQIRALEIDGSPLPSLTRRWLLKNDDEKMVGQISSAAWSPDFNTHVAIGMVGEGYWESGTVLLVETPEGTREARVQEKFWI